MVGIRRMAVLRSKGGPTYGNELVIGGDFASSTGWTLAGGASITGGVLSMSGAGSGNAQRTAAETLTTGNYFYAFDLVSTAGSAGVIVSIGNFVNNLIGATTAGHYEGTFNVPSITNQIVFIQSNNNVCQIDNFSIKKVTP